ncbi:MAG: phosphoribosylanthranilate isomerase [Rhodobacterales bacterium]|mgnify:FL=1|jgi:phosphoribosylanthranilate isomerase|nr:phosphoribosylanthranilate isomerase [Planktomarina sp.]MDA9100709.1 phosphoribosylanthranilate isomerase [Planktomarina sp.]|tara:strand:+ start:190 stop:828 length:639 start_codon:yes stop_codon:yes gene_type:complete
MSIRCKLCGLTTLDDISAAVRADASYIGFVFFLGSPRNLEIQAANLLLEATPKHVTKVGLVVDADNNFLDRLTSSACLDMLQLHGNETYQRVAEVKARYGLSVMKAVGISNLGDVRDAQHYGEVADQLLLDAKPNSVSDLPGGNGISFDWNLLAGSSWKVPWMLAGGLNPNNVASAVKLSGARQVDVSSGIETAPGKNNAELMSEFVMQANV